MTESCCPHVKNIQATFVRYNANQNRESKASKHATCSSVAGTQQPKEASAGCPPTCAAEHETEEFHSRVLSLKTKLEEANANIAMLRSWVGDADELVKQAKPKRPKNVKEELRSLIGRLDNYENQLDLITGRGAEAVKTLDGIEDEDQCCASNSDSIAKLRQQLNAVRDAKRNLDVEISGLQLENERKAVEDDNPIIQEQVIDDLKNEISEVKKSCTVDTCPKYVAELEKSDRRSSGFVNVAVQNKIDAPSKKPKLSQTNTKARWSQGTNPCLESGCGKR